MIVVFPGHTYFLFFVFASAVGMQKSCLPSLRTIPACALPGAGLSVKTKNNY